MGPGEKECSHNISEGCFGIAPKEMFKGSLCKMCHTVYMQEHYRRNRERILARAKARYVPSGRLRGRPRNAEKQEDEALYRAMLDRFEREHRDVRVDNLHPEEEVFDSI